MRELRARRYPTPLTLLATVSVASIACAGEPSGKNAAEMPAGVQASRRTVEDLRRKDLLRMLSLRGLAYQQTARQTTAEVVADLGNIQINGYCRFRDIVAPHDSTMHWWSTTQQNVKVLRLIEEGREKPEFVSSLLRKEIEVCLSEHGAALDAYVVEARKGRGGGKIDSEYYNRHGRYKCPLVEYGRLHDVVYASLYILANIDRLDSVLIADWLGKPKRRQYGSRDMNVWLIDCYYKQEGAKTTEHGRKYATLTKGLNISGALHKQSRWNALEGRDHSLLRTKNVDVSGVKTIEVLDIPRELSVPNETKEQILAIFMKDPEKRRR